MSAEQIARELPAQRDEAEGAFELWADHLPAFLLMNGLSTQWRTEVLMHERVVYLGFDYSVLPVVERGTGVTCTPDVFHHLQVMELEAAKTRNA